jgi:hypothetical protein
MTAEKLSAFFAGLVMAIALAVLLLGCAPCPPDPARPALGALVITSTEDVSNSAALRNARAILGQQWGSP